ncbi:TOPRIM nucleotidyl transferase/hydrolase domain-containing protein [Sedimenticola sp.]|uniref:TOPRIM nucleotidyl transferase/hydrolase domain-containing protein n=1 Tax=Sedimenticola sp. TaxID=1940285 RepID=UPI003D0D02E4
MEKLSDFKPLKRVSLPGIGNLTCAGLVVIVGPNSAGKSQFLKDIFHRLSGEPRTLVVADDIEVSKPEYEPFIRCLESEGYFETIYDENGKQQWRPRTTYLGTGQAIGQIDLNQAKNLHNQYSPTEKNNYRRSEYLNYFGRLLVTALFLDRRLTSLNQVGVIDFQEQPPQQDLHALYLDDDARSKLFNEMLESFGKAVWPDTSRGNLLCIRVSDEGVLPTAEDRLSPKKMSAYRTIESEGDGLKSYVATCVSLLLGRRPVCIVDEPEMCLHPPQAYNLGRFIGHYGSSPDTATFVATHSSQVLRGIIQTGQNIQIVRLVRIEDKFIGHLVPAEILSDAIKKPTVRAESVLDGIFSQSVIVVEGDGDRLVYQTTLETLSPELRLDAHFAAVGGVGGIGDTCKLYRTLNIPICVIADLDLINDPDRLKIILNELTTNKNAASFSEEAKNIMTEIRKLPPNISPSELADELKTLLPVTRDWELEEDITVRKKLRKLANDLDRMRRLKRGGVSEFPDTIRDLLVSLIYNLKSHGLFLVPVGELEEWLKDEGINESKNNKWAWANTASICIQEKGAKQGDIWDFMREIGKYLCNGK